MTKIFILQNCPHYADLREVEEDDIYQPVDELAIQWERNLRL
jgi:hypothetical protein